MEEVKEFDTSFDQLTERPLSMEENATTQTNKKYETELKNFEQNIRYNLDIFK